MRLSDELQGQTAYEQNADQDTDPDRLAALHRAFRPRYFTAIDIRGDWLRPKGCKHDGAFLGDPDFVLLRLADRELGVSRCPDREHPDLADQSSAIDSDSKSPSELVPRVYDLVQFAVSYGELKPCRHSPTQSKGRQCCV